MTQRKRILMVVTSHENLGSASTKTGFWLEELAAPYVEFERAGVDITLASPRGGKPPVDPKSEHEPSAAVRAFQSDARAIQSLASTKRLADVSADVSADFDAYFVVGGHGVMWDLAEDPVLTNLLARAHSEGKVIAAVCHGVVALLPVKQPNGKPLLDGRRVTGFSNKEEELVGLSKVVPFALESALRERGGRYESGAPWASFMVADERLVAGQNPASSVAVAQKALALLG